MLYDVVGCCFSGFQPVHTFVVAFNLTSISFHSNPVSLFMFRPLAFAQQTWRHFCQVLFSPRTLEWPQSMRSWTLPNGSSKLEPDFFQFLSNCWKKSWTNVDELGARRSQQGHSHEGRSSPSKDWSATRRVLGQKKSGPVPGILSFG